MKGQELIDWIKAHHAEEMMVVVQYRDSGGIYPGFDKEITPWATKLPSNEPCGKKVVVL